MDTVTEKEVIKALKAEVKRLIAERDEDIARAKKAEARIRYTIKHANLDWLADAVEMDAKARRARRSTRSNNPGRCPAAISPWGDE